MAHILTDENNSDEKFSIQYENRFRQYPLSGEQEYPPYLLTCVDEFSRDLCTFSISKFSQILAPYKIRGPKIQFSNVEEQINFPSSMSDGSSADSQNDNRSRLLCHYYPCYPATLNKKANVPIARLSLEDRAFRDTKLLIRVDDIKFRNNLHMFEPMFGSLCLYTFNNDEKPVFVRASESFFFDITSSEIARKLPEVYMDAFESNSKNGSIQHPITQTRQCLFSIPPALKNDKLYLVWLCYKILTGDQDKAFAPYLGSGRAPTITDKMNLETCKRLSRYRQLLAAGSIQPFSKDGSITGKNPVSIPAFAIHSPVTDEQFGRDVKEMYFPDGKNDKCKLDFLNMDLQVTITEWDKDPSNYVENGLSPTKDSSPLSTPPTPPPPSQRPLSTSSTVSLQSYHSYAPPPPPSMSQSASQSASQSSLSTLFSAVSKVVVPAEFHVDFGFDASAYLSLPPALVRAVIPLTPSHLRGTDDNSRRTRTVIDHSLFVYPITLENFDIRWHRNLCIRVQLIELKESVPVNTPLDLLQETDYDVLTNIYNTLPGPLFRSAALTTVWKHSNPPYLLDEIKIRLPVLITRKHHLLLAVSHVHIKNKDESNITNAYGLFGKKSEATDDNTCKKICTGFLPLLAPDGNLISDQEYSVTMFPEFTEESSVPGKKKAREVVEGAPYQVKFVTKAWSSLISTSKEVQEFFRNQPPALGKLPSSVMPPRSPATPGANETKFLSDSSLVTIITQLHKAPAIEVSRHFLSIMRILVRIMCGGNGVFDERYCSPYSIPQPRVIAFEGMLNVFAKVDENDNRKNFLIAYVDHFFDEEIPLGISKEDVKSHTPFSNENSNQDDVTTKEDVQEGIDSSPQTQTYPLLPGYDSRVATIESAMRHSLKQQARSGVHWWPWIYEVFVKIWLQILDIDIQYEEDLEDSNAENEDDVDEENNEIDEEIDAISVHSSGRADMMLSRPKSTSSTLSMKFLSPDGLIHNRAVVDLTVNYGSILLRMILKSIALRVSRERHATPVVLDDTLVTMLTDLTSGIANSIIRCPRLRMAKKLNEAVAQFHGELFLFLAPYQVARLVYAHVFAIRKHKKLAIQVELRAQYLQELSSFDDFVAVNFPLPLTSPLDDFRLVLMNENLLLTAEGLPPHWLAHVIIEEAMRSYRLPIDAEEVRGPVRLKGIGILRDLLVKHSYDVRYRDTESQQRISAMYLPYISQIIHISENRLLLPSCNEFERKEVLSILLYVLENVTEQLLRDQWRKLSIVGGVAIPQPQSLSILEKVNRGEPIKMIGMQSSPTNSRTFGSNRELKEASAKAAGSTASPTPSNGATINELPITRLLKYFHIVIDSFEFQASNSTDSDNLTRCLVGPLESPTKGTRPIGKTPVITRSILSGKGQNASAYMEKLAQMNASRVDAGRRGRKSVGANQEELRDWYVHAQSSNLKRSSYTPVTLTNIHPDILLFAAMRMSHESSCVVLDTLQMILEESPPLIAAISTVSERDTVNSEFMHVAVSLLLHGLSYRLSVPSVVKFYIASEKYLQKFGFRVFMSAAGDTLQDWFYVTLSHCCSVMDDLRKAACDFLVCLLESCISSMGSISIIQTTSLAVISNVIAHEISKEINKKNNMKTLVNPFKPMKDSLEDMKSTVQSKVKADPSQSAFGLRVTSLLNTFEIVLAAEEQLRLYFPDLVSISDVDWHRSNCLDGKLSDKMMRGESRRLTVENLKLCDIDGLIGWFSKAAEVFDPIILPRYRILWLENIARVHDALGNRAESAEVRWKIYCTCAAVEHTWSNLWTARVPLMRKREDSSGDGSLQFFDLVQKYKVTELAPCRPWLEKAELTRHMELCLATCARFYADTGLVYLAERAWVYELNILRAEKLVPKMATVYRSLEEAFSKVTDATTAFALGSFYRVQYSGLGAPDQLRGKEFIFRNANHLRLAEFQLEVKKQLECSVGKGTNVLATSDTAYVVPEDSKDAHVLVVTANPVLLATVTSNSILHNHGHHSHEKPSAKLPDEMVALNQVQHFQFSVPFTLDGKTHAKEIQNQWKRTVTLTVKDPFPYILIRQEVISRQIRVLTPIEVAVEDIRDRVQMMKIEQSKELKDGDLNNLMRIVQGSVAPQVNAGAAETAKVFLSAIGSDQPPPLVGVPDERAHILRQQLKEILVEFLICAKQLLRRCREAFGLNDQSSDKNGANGGDASLIGDRFSVDRPPSKGLRGGKEPVTPSEPPKPIPFNQIWLEEMTSKSNNLINLIIPFVRDVHNLAALVPSS